MIEGKVKGERIEVKIEGSIIDLLSELQLLNVHVMDEISKCLKVSLYDVFELSYKALEEVIKEGDIKNGKSNS